MYYISMIETRYFIKTYNNLGWVDNINYLYATFKNNKQKIHLFLFYSFSKQIMEEWEIKIIKNNIQLIIPKKHLGYPSADVFILWQLSSIIGLLVIINLLVIVLKQFTIFDFYQLFQTQITNQYVNELL